MGGEKQILCRRENTSISLYFSMKHSKALTLGLVFAAFSILQTQAHNPNQSYIFLRIFEASVEGHIDIAIGEYNRALGLQLEQDMTVEELQNSMPRLQAFLKENLEFTTSAGVHQLQFKEVRISKQGNLGDYVQIDFVLDGLDRVPEELQIESNILFDQDPTHQTLVVIELMYKGGIINNEAQVSLVLDEDDRQGSIALEEGSLWLGFKAMIEQGIWHILIGIDHILFLLALILPSVVRRKIDRNLENKPWSLSRSAQSWQPVTAFKPAFIYIIKIITFFTIAHSITLSLATLNIVNLPSRLVESIIALSIALAALNNIRPLFGANRDWVIAFGFGLFHGFGFASVLGDLGLTGEHLVTTLLGFNLGVEIGQLGIILIIFPLLFLLRNHRLYPKGVVYGSIVLIFISLYWFIERVFEIDLLLWGILKKAIISVLKFLGLR